MDQLLRQLAAAAQAHTQAPPPALPALAGLQPGGAPPHAASALQLYAVAAGWAPFLALHPLGSSHPSQRLGAATGACGSASVHMLRHLALLQRANAAAAASAKLQELKEQQQLQRAHPQQAELELEALEPTSHKLLRAEANEGEFQFILVLKYPLIQYCLASHSQTFSISFLLHS